MTVANAAPVMPSSSTCDRVTFSAIGTVVFFGLAGCSGGGPSGAVVHRDAGTDGAFSYGLSSSSGMGLQSGSSSGGDDVDATAADDSTTTPSDDAPGTDAPTGDAASADGGSSDSGGGAASSCVRPEGGLPCDPGLVGCGGESCSTASSFCCVGGAEGGAGDICSPFNGASCPGSALTIACDETADCTGSVCCEEIVSLGVAGPTQCMASCPSGWFQVCKTDTECGDGHDAGRLNRCVVQTCTEPSGLFGGGSSVTVEACAVPASLGNLNNGGALAGCVAQ
jgi:hypothetical protein